MFSNKGQHLRLATKSSSIVWEILVHFLFRGTEPQKELGEGWGYALTVRFQ